MQQMNSLSLRQALLQSVTLTALLLQVSAAQSTELDCIEGLNCNAPSRGQVVDDSSSIPTTIAENTETADDPSEPVAALDGFSLSVDGEVVAGQGTVVDAQRTADVGLNDADIQVKFDGLEVRPMLNVSTVPATQNYVAGEVLEFQASLNYAAWISRAEVIISKFDGVRSSVIAEVNMERDGTATWRVPDDMTSKLSYVLRVYDAEGRYDETLPRPLTSKDNPITGLQDNIEDGVVPGRTAAPGVNEDNTALRNILVQGGSVTIYGRGIEGKGDVYAFGETVPVDAEGNFLIQRILPPGDHTVDVEVRGADGNNLDFTRQINIPTDDWFYVGLADFTLGKRLGNKDMKSVYPGEYDGIYNKGRLAFYLKGKIKGSMLLTAALDTGEHDVRDILKQLDEKDPRRFLKRIDPDDYYPVYGDDSSAIEDAPTAGRFYVRLKKDDSHVMWGNYKAYISGNKFLSNERALYGAQAVHKSNKVALDGSRTTEISAHAAQPGTLTQNDTLRGTGGSAYFTKHQDITQGTETIAIETRDPVTGFVISKTTLKAGTDYDIDYSQGVILLNNPLPSLSNGKYIYLVANYEYTPATTEVKGYAAGGRAHQWLGKHVRVGVTTMRDYSGEANLTLGGADVRLQATEKSYIDFHAARSKGKGFGYSASADGGLTYSEIAPIAGARKAANAFGVSAKADLEEVTNGRLKGDLQADYAHKKAGFTTLDNQINERKEDIRVASNIEVSEKTSFGVEASQSRSGKDTDREVKAAVKHHLTEKTSIEFGVKNTQKSGSVAPVDERGNRTDLGVKLSHDIDDNTSAYVFGQVTAKRGKNRERDDRVGVGGKTDLNEKVGLEGEVSGGSQGLGGSAKVVFTPNADAKYYFGYELDPYRELDTNSSFISSGNDLGAFIVGGRQKVSDQLSFYVEDSYDLFGLKRTLAQNYGMEYAPMENWTIVAAVEMGHIYDDTINSITNIKNSDFDRKAGSVTVGYRHENGNAARLKGEVRFEDSKDAANSRDMTSYLMEATVNWRANDDWRFIGNVDAVFSEATSATRDGEYVEGSLGFAYRPTEDDRLNALFKYTYLYDLPGADQVTVNGTLNGPYQRSHILSADAIYDVSEILSVGAKYGMRYGETRERTGGAGWTDNVAHLAILRGDINVIREWDVLLEGRMLWSPTSKSTDFGALAAVYRHMGENFKVGVGYNFGRFSDDLTDLVADDHGVFVNAIGKF
jgi:hypothetical protein